MDELDLIARLRADAAPTAEVAERHRAELRAAMGPALRPAPAGEAAATAGAEDVGPPSRPRRPWLLAAAAVVAVVVAAVAAVLASQEGERDVRVASAPPAPACGTDLPVPPPAPAAAARPGASPDSETEPADGQLIQHWVTPAMSIEARWPADADLGVTLTEGDAPPEQALIVLLEETADARLTQAVLAVFLPDQHPACRWVQIRLAGRPEIDKDALRAVADRLPRGGRAVMTPHGFAADGLVVDRGTVADDDGELVVARATASAPPRPGTCRAPAGMTPPPNRSARVPSPAPHATPEAALAAFLATGDATTFPRSGYTELALADGSFAYAHESEPGFVTVVVHVEAAGDRWAATHWETTGC